MLATPGDGTPHLGCHYQRAHAPSPMFVPTLRTNRGGKQNQQSVMTGQKSCPSQISSLNKTDYSTLG